MTWFPLPPGAAGRALADVPKCCNRLVVRVSPKVRLVSVPSFALSFPPLSTLHLTYHRR